MINKFKQSENRIHILIFIITILVATSPLMSRYCIDGHDIGYHLLRIESLKQGILIGKPFLKVNTLFMGDAGYASSMFYSDLFMYIPALLRVCGVSINASYHIFAALIFILCYGSTFYCALRISKSKYVATIAAVLLTLCPYHMDDMIIRAACGEYSAFVFAPFVIYGIYNILYEEIDRPWAFALGFGGLILTHPATLVMNVVLCAVIFVIYIKKFIQNPKLVLKVLVTTIVTVAVTAFQWAPMLEQMISTSFSVEGGTLNMLYGALQMRQIFSQDFPAMGFVLPLIAVLRILIKRQDEDNVLAFADVLLIFAFFTAIGVADIWPWDKVSSILQFMQFPWRLFAISSVLFAIADAIIVVRLVEECKVKDACELLMVIVLIISTGLAIPRYQNLYDSREETENPYYDYGQNYYDYKPFTGEIIGGEWLPSTVTEPEAIIELSDHMILDDGSENDFVRSRAEIFADIPTGTEYVDVPFIFYKGYKAVLTDASGVRKDLLVTAEGIDGFCRVYTEGLAGQLKVYYGGTVIIKASAIISLLTLAGYVVCEVMKRKKHNNM